MYQICTKPKGGFAMNAIKKMEKQSGFRLFLLILPLLMLVFCVFLYAFVWLDLCILQL